MMMRANAAVLACLWLVAPALAQTPTQEEGQMRLYIQQLEDRVRQLTGENERLMHENGQLRAKLGLPVAEAAPQQSGAVEVGQNLPQQAPGQDAGTYSVSPDDPLIAPDGATEATDGAPIDLSALANGVAGDLVGSQDQGAAPAEPADGSTQTAGLPAAPPALSGSPKDQYDLAYGYILTGDYGLAEESFKAWLASFPNDPLAGDAEFWLGESHLQQGEYRDAANAFLNVYKTAPNSAKGPDALLKLGMSLSALGEKTAACATFNEVGRKYPQATPSLMSRVHDEAKRDGC